MHSREHEDQRDSIHRLRWDVVKEVISSEVTLEHSTPLRVVQRMLLERGKQKELMVLISYRADTRVNTQHWRAIPFLLVYCCKEWSLVTGDATFTTATGSSQHFSNLLLTEGRTVCDILISRSFRGVFFLKDDTKSAALAVPDKPTLYETSFSFPSGTPPQFLCGIVPLRQKTKDPNPPSFLVSVFLGHSGWFVGSNTLEYYEGRE